jgi:hypothetical protein
MKIDWVVVWQEFENELSNRLQEGVLNEWGMQQEIIERVIERNLTPLAPDLGWACGKCKSHNLDGDSLCGFCDTPRLSG